MTLCVLSTMQCTVSFIVLYFNILEIQAGYYSKVDDVIEALHQTLKEHEPQALNSISFSYSKISGKVTVTLKNGAEVAFDDDIAAILGFETSSDPDTKMLSSTTTSKYAANVSGGIYSLYVYCDIIQSQVVGDSQVPLLRIVPIDGQHGEVLTRSFQTPQYYPLSRKQFDTIEIDINDDTGSHPSFEYGKVLITLHFRSVKSALFK